MKVGLFIPKNTVYENLTDGLLEGLKLDRTGYESYFYECPCENELDTPSKDGLNVAIIHSHRRMGCYGKVRGMIEKNPDTYFFVFAVGNSYHTISRREKIGEHPNLSYSNFLPSILLPFAKIRDIPLVNMETVEKIKEMFSLG